MNSEKWLKLFLFIAIMGLILKFISIDRTNINTRKNYNHNHNNHNNHNNNNNHSKNTNNTKKNEGKCNFTKEDAIKSIKDDKIASSEKISQCNSKCSSRAGSDSEPSNAECKSCTDLLPVMDPMYNMREMCKQVILLEDHLFQKEKRCHDCICKHFLTIEALAEEAITLDKYHKYPELNDIPSKVRVITKKYINNHKDTSQHAITAQELRELRKTLMQKSFNHF
jgi:hypothetical protein